MGNRWLKIYFWIFFSKAVRNKPTKHQMWVHELSNNNHNELLGSFAWTNWFVSTIQSKTNLQFIVILSRPLSRSLRADPLYTLLSASLVFTANTWTRRKWGKTPSKKRFVIKSNSSKRIKKSRLPKDTHLRPIPSRVFESTDRNGSRNESHCTISQYFVLAG